jgi:iron complex transport system substrate-binding protein
LASATEMLYALGAGDRVVAVSHECDFPAEATGKPRVTVSHVAAPSSLAIDDQVRGMLAAGEPLSGIDAAVLVALSPDLIITQAQCDVCAVKYQDVLDLVACEPALRTARVVALNPTTLEEIFADILRVGEAIGRSEAAADYVNSLRARVDAVRSRAMAPVVERPRTVCIEWIDPLMLAANWMPQLVEWAGGIQSLDAQGRHSTYNSWDEVVRFDPQVLIVMPCGFDLARAVAESDTLKSKPGWSELSAVKSGQIYAVDGNAYFNRSGPRIVDSVEILAGLIHPERFGLPAEVITGTAVWRSLV